MLSALISIPELETLNYQLKPYLGKTVSHSYHNNNVTLKFVGTVNLLDGKVRANGQLIYQRGRKSLIYTGHWYNTVLFVSYFSYGPIIYSGRGISLNGICYNIESETSIVTHLRVRVPSNPPVKDSNNFILHVPIVDGAEFQLELDLDETIFDITTGNSFSLIPGLSVDKLVTSAVGSEKEIMFNFVVCVEADRITFTRTNFSSDEGNYIYEHSLENITPMKFLATIFQRLPRAPSSKNILQYYLRNC